MGDGFPDGGGRAALLGNRVPQNCASAGDWSGHASGKAPNAIFFRAPSHGQIGLFLWANQLMEAAEAGRLRSVACVSARPLHRREGCGQKILPPGEADAAEAFLAGSFPLPLLEEHDAI